MERVTVSPTSVSCSQNATLSSGGEHSECIEDDERKAELPSSGGSAAARRSLLTTGAGGC